MHWSLPDAVWVFLLTLLFRGHDGRFGIVSHMNQSHPLICLDVILVSLLLLQLAIAFLNISLRIMHVLLTPSKGERRSKSERHLEL